MAASDSLYLQAEKINKSLPSWLDKPWNIATDLIDKRGELEKIGQRDYRVPFDTLLGGRGGAYDANFGDMGRGSGPEGNYLVSSYFSTRRNYELSHLVIKATNDKSVAKKNVLSETLKNAIPSFMNMRDKWFHSNGTAVVAIATAHSSGSGVSVYTLDSVHGTSRLERGQYYTIYNPGLTAALSSSTLRVTSIDTVARTATFSGIVPGASATDNICIEGVSGPSPVGYKGLYYWHSTAVSGTTGGVNRATEPEIVANGVDGSGGLTPMLFVLAYHRSAERRGEMADGLIGLASMAQHAAALNNILVIQTMDISKGVPENLDRLPKGVGLKRMFEMGGIPIYIDKHQAKDRIDIFPPKVWGRTQLDGLHFYKPAVTRGGAEDIFIDLKGGSGGPAAGVWFGLTLDEDFFSSNPGAATVIYSLPIGTNYGG